MTSKKEKESHVVQTSAPHAAAMDGEDEVADDPQLNMATGVAVSGSGYRNRALEHYKRLIGGSHVNVCVMCGFGIPAILEIAHLDQDRKNNSIENLAPLCPNCHKMHDIGLIPTAVVQTMREREYVENWGARMKDAGSKAAQTRQTNALRAKKSASAKKAWQSRGASALKAEKGS